jgi:hypothetical protein
MQFIGSTATGSNFGQLDRYVLDTIQLAMDYDVTTNSVPGSFHIHTSYLKLHL